MYNLLIRCPFSSCIPFLSSFKTLPCLDAARCSLAGWGALTHPGHVLSATAMVYVLHVAFTGCCSLLSQAAKRDSRLCRQPRAGSPRWLTHHISQTSIFRAPFSGHRALFLLVQNEPCICERILAHTQGKIVALYNPCPTPGNELLQA